MASASKRTRLLLLLGGTAAIGLIGWAGASAIGHQIQRAAWVIPLALALHALQLLIAAWGWRVVTERDRPGLLAWWRIRWIREAVNAMLPVAQIGGNVAGVRLLAQAGVPLPRAGAGTVLDVTAEAASQALFTLLGIALLAATSANRAWVPWISGGLPLLVGGVAGLALAQRLGLLRLIERVAARFGGAGLHGLHAETMRLARHGTGLAGSTALHLLSWSLGTFETLLALYAMGVRASVAQGFVIESLAMAARSVGFAVPGALGVQETGFVLVAGLFGIPAETAIALSMVKRARELAMGVGGLLAWQWSRGAGEAAVARGEPGGRSRAANGDTREAVMSDLPPVLPPELPGSPKPTPGPDLPPVPEELPGVPIPGENPGDLPPPLVAGVGATK
jgi:putative membrane protein